MDKRIVVVGAGAIGGYTGGNLAHNGFDVTLIDPWPEHVEAIRRDGLALEGVTPEEFVLARPKTLHLTEVQHLAKERPIDIAFISMKSYDTEWATTMIRQYLAPAGYVVSLQNCINEERIAGDRRLGPDGRRDRRDPLGRTLRAGQDPPHRRQKPARPRGLPGRRSARPGHPAHRGTRRDDRHYRHLQGHRQSVGRALVETVRQRHAQRRLGGERPRGNAMRQDARVRRVIIKFGGEAVRIGQARATGSRISRGRTPRRWRARRKATAALDEVESLMLALRNSQQRSEQQRPSMGQDMQKGRRTEIDFINGVIVEKGAEIGGRRPELHAKYDRGRELGRAR